VGVTKKPHLYTITKNHHIMQLSEVRSLANALMTQHGLIDQGWRFKFDHAKRRLGCCKYGPKLITMSRHLVPHVKPEELKNTILHEIAHALTPGHGHDRVWQAKAIEFGCTGERCYSSAAFREGGREAVVKQAKYTLECPGCGIKHPMHRKPRVSKSCGKCSGGRYNPTYKLTVTQNY